jgi:tetratricopeptide (TPR) repeat protein
VSEAPTAARWLRWLRWLLYAVTLGAYAWALSSPFQFDDRGVILREASVQSLDAAVTSLGGLRPLLKLSYAASWALGGGSPLAFHVFNLLLHLVNVELVLRLYRAAADRSSRFPFRGSLEPGALVAGVLFALHPIQTEAVTYVSGRSASLATCFSLCALLLFAHGVRTLRPRFWLGYTALAFAAAVATKETSATLPLGLLLWDLSVERSAARAALGRFAAWFALAVVAVVVLIMSERYFALLYNVLGQRSLADALRFQLFGLAYVAERLALLSPPCIDPGLFLARPSWAAAGATGAVVAGALLLAGWRARRGAALELFGLGWFLLQVFVPFVVLSRVDVINERHAYAGNAGLFLACGSLLAAVAAGRGRVARPVLLLALALGLAALTWRRNLDYASEVSLWRATVRSAPLNPRAHNNLGVAYELAGRLSEARIAYSRALTLEPRYAAARDNLIRTNRPRLTPP